MDYGFYLFIDEAGDEGLTRIRPVDANGSSEYFVISGVLIRTQNYNALAAHVSAIKSEIGLQPYEPLHFSDLSEAQRRMTIERIADFKMGLIAIVSNKLNMRNYRNERCEAKHFEIVDGRKRPKNHNWFYNGLVRYLLERASNECARWTHKIHGTNLPIRIVFAHRKGFSYGQTRSYLYRLQVSRHGRDYFNNRGQINWSVVRLQGIESLRPRNEPGLQVADCVASSIFRSIDNDWFGGSDPCFLATLAPRFVSRGRSPAGYGFKLLPDDFRAELSSEQLKALGTVGYAVRGRKLVIL